MLICSLLKFGRSMVNCITLNSSSRVVLASCRNAFTMVSFPVYYVMSTLSRLYIIIDFWIHLSLNFMFRLPTLAYMQLLSLCSMWLQQKHKITSKIRCDCCCWLHFKRTFSEHYDWNMVLMNEQYRWIAYVSIFIGCCFVGIFHVGTKEPRSDLLHSLQFQKDVCKHHVTNKFFIALCRS